MRTLHPIRHLRLRPPRHLSLTPHLHKPYSSSSSSSSPPLSPPPVIIESYLDFARKKFSSQRPKHLPTVLTPDKADQLTLALEDANPSFCQSHDEYEDYNLLPQGYHMVYFEPKVSSYTPMLDGTDPYHFPGQPFERRMWTGGSVTFTPEYHSRMLLSDSTEAECIETVNPRATQFKGEDKVFVEISRDYYVTSPPTTPSQPESKIKVLSETRKLVFLRPLPPPPQKPLPQSPSSPEESSSSEPSPSSNGEVVAESMSKLELEDKPASASVPKTTKKIKAPWNPLFSFPLTPSHQLLSLFSVLTNNAHRIHLDTRYARRVEGYKDTLVHGPLTLVLMLEGLTSYLYKSGGGSLEERKKRWVREMNYRNLAPLFRGDKMNVCGALAKTKGENKEGKEEEWVLWIEDQEGGLAVKGNATVVSRR
ncbi:hypothetical protein QBC36DRAFT_353403 [Triangularia setosa]|uniref:Uncharacterized protein n=1 Tax=Triangularia setosa TaxID=2587417 RepID=A0AAN6W6N3_9PEZI|nr:hypothetical protein QBC36DRAFT_353403 [Podospora setosa]